MCLLSPDLLMVDDQKIGVTLIRCNSVGIQTNKIMIWLELLNMHKTPRPINMYRLTVKMRASGKVWIFIRYNLIYSSDTQGTWHFKQFAKVWTFLNFPLYIERLKFSSFVILFTHCPNIFHQSYVVVKVKCSVMESNWSRPEHWFFSLTQGFTNILVSIFMHLCAMLAK